MRAQQHSKSLSNNGIKIELSRLNLVILKWEVSKVG